jgi:hypothetical protein
MEARYSLKFTWCVLIGSCWSLYWIVQSPPTLAQCLALLVACYFATDLISGLLHIVLDNPRSLSIGLIRTLAQGFQDHHDDPSEIFEMSLFNHLYVMHLPLTIFFVAVLPFHDTLFYVVFLTMSAMLHLMQMSHRWAHLPVEEVPGAVRVLQRTRFLIGRQRHDQHHKPPYAKDFCIMTGLCNPPLNRLAKTFGVTSHWWGAAFLSACLLPLIFAGAAAYI